MASNINPYNIDTTFPIAGQDNDTQGFRTNYTSIQNNFSTAAGEITSLQSNVASIQTTFLPSYTGNIAATAVNVSTGVFWANGASALYNNAQVAAYLPTYTGNISAGNLTVTNISYVNQETISTSEIVTGNISVGSNIHFTSSTITLANIVPTTVYAFGNATAIYLGNINSMTTVAGNVKVTNTLTLGSAIQFANLTTAQVTAIASPQRGMTVYNYTTGNVQVYNGTKWANVTLS